MERSTFDAQFDAIQRIKYYTDKVATARIALEESSLATLELKAKFDTSLSQARQFVHS